MNDTSGRRDFLKLGMAGLATAGALTAISAEKAAAQAASDSVLRTALDRGKLILFDDPSKVEFVQQDPAQRIPNVTTNKVDITIQFMTMTAQRSQLVHFSRPYYVEGVALLTLPGSENKTFD
ncbi:MAG: transporter substrate-binding domain-containing protein, partial [Mesorhizobium sp.]